MQLKEPLYSLRPLTERASKDISLIQPAYSLDKDTYHNLAERINRHKKVLIFSAMNKPCNALSESLKNISHGNIVVLSEILSNNKHDNIICNIDRLFTEMSDNEWQEFSPDLLITIGGAPVSRLLKTFLRKTVNIEHWRIGCDRTLIDTMQNITYRIDMEPATFFSDIEPLLTCSGDYHSKWRELTIKAETSHKRYIENSPWSDLKAMSIIMSSLPTTELNLQISNGSSIRYADILGIPQGFTGTCHCNRGVSGIDGSTSTALGASMTHNGTTLLITGDMSFSYDLSGLASQYNSEHFKIIVLCNGGGGIFRFINEPSTLPDFEKYFEVHRDIPVAKYAKAFGFDYFEAKDEESLKRSLINLFRNNKASILAVYTNNKISAKTLKGYFNRNK